MIICEFHHMRGITKPANYGVRIAKLDWYLCYNCMMEEAVAKRGHIVKTIKSAYYIPKEDNQCHQS